MNDSRNDHDGSHPALRARSIAFAAFIMLLFIFGFYSLFLALAHSGEPRPFATAGVSRTATANDGEKISTALGGMSDPDVVFVVLEATSNGSGPDVNAVARRAAKSLGDAGLKTSVRVVGSADPDFEQILTQNRVIHLPAVLVVKRLGGIVRVAEDLNQENLVRAYREAWGIMSPCGGARSEIY